MLCHTEMQLDFILEMHALDNPKEFIFERSGNIKPLSEQETLAQWDKVLIGKSWKGFFAGMLPPKAVIDRAMGIRDAGITLMQNIKSHSNKSG